MRFDANSLRDAFRGGKRLIAGRGAKFVEFDLTSKSLDWAAVAKAVLGPSGNLRAPTIRVGSDYFVGFVAEAWRQRLG